MTVVESAGKFSIVGVLFMEVLMSGSQWCSFCEKHLEEVDVFFSSNNRKVHICKACVEEAWKDLCGFLVDKNGSVILGNPMMKQRGLFSFQIGDGIDEIEIGFPVGKEGLDEE